MVKVTMLNTKRFTKQISLHPDQRGNFEVITTTETNDRTRTSGINENLKRKYFKSYEAAYDYAFMATVRAEKRGWYCK